MNRRYATHLPRAAVALLAAAGTVWLSAFFLPAAVVAPIRLLPAIGSAPGKVVSADGLSTRKPAAVHTVPTRTTITTPVVASAQLARATFVPKALPAPHEARTVRRRVRVHRNHRLARPKHFAPPSRVVPASTSASSAPVFDSVAPRGQAVGWHRKHDRAETFAASSPTRGHGHGHANHDAPAVQSAPAPVMPPSARAQRHDNGKHLGDEHGNGHGDQDHGRGGKK
jgi:hypothetical protein